MLEEYIYHGTEKLRCGYTTGSCAAAAAKAAAVMLLSGGRLGEVALTTPKGICLKLAVRDIQAGEDTVSCAIKKDSGDDPDITNGILVYASVRKQAAGIFIEGGKGIGTVTRSGLDQPVGGKAINSVPRQMIEQELLSVGEQYGYDGGFAVTISVPQGEELAGKTFNPRMGIEGGISIIGTSGIVEPMSAKALLDTVRLEMKQKREEGERRLVLTMGNYGEGFLAEQMPGELNRAVKCSNFIGDAISMGMEYGFESILLVGHIGKLVKLGAGIMNTHSMEADGRMEVLVCCGLLAGVEKEVLKQILDCVTVDEALGIFDGQGKLEQVISVLRKRIQFYLEARVKHTVPIGAVLFSNKYGMLGKTGEIEI